MRARAVYVTGLGIAGPTGPDLASLRQALEGSRACFARLAAFAPRNQEAKPAGQAAWLTDGPLSRTHRLASAAARQALAGRAPPEALVLGVTTGGMPESEQTLVAPEADPAALAHHATGDIAWSLAREFACSGPALTVSTACSSAAAAIKLALEILRRGLADRILAGGADGLCEMTHFGFDVLKLVDPAGARPLDVSRAGLTVAEAGAMLLLEAQDAAAPPPAAALARLSGGGLSCDAYHATAPHPDGDGALAAMRAALDDAGLRAEQIDYVNLHGTGTPDNDRAEARALRRLFDPAPRLSSTKGVTGHPLAAAGAVESVLVIDAIVRGRAPGNAGLSELDPELGIEPLRDATPLEIRHALSNSFGFGGNNAALVWSRPDALAAAAPEMPGPGGLPVLYVRRTAAVTGAGFEQESLRRLLAGESCAGCLADERLVEGLAPRALRRLKRVGRLALALERRLSPEPGEAGPEQILMGTGWGALSETHDFLQRLFASPERLSSPSDFVGSVHNAPAGLLALRQAARGANLCMTGGDVSFEQALLAASLLLPTGGQASAWLLGLDEGHALLSPRLDASVARGPGPLSDGAGGLVVETCERDALASLRLLGLVEGDERGSELFLERLRQAPADAMLWLNIPAAEQELAESQLAGLTYLTGTRAHFDLRAGLGQFASVSAVACALAVDCLVRGESPGEAGPCKLGPGGILVLSLGRHLAATHIGPLRRGGEESA